MSKVILGSRLLLGIIFLVFGANGFAMFTIGKGFIPMPPPSPEMAQAMGGFMAIKYLMPSVKFLQMLCGILLLSNKLVPLALVILAPIVYNILAVHLFIDLAGLPMALFITALLAVQFYAHRETLLVLVR